LGRTLDAKVDMVKTTLPFVARAVQSANASSASPSDEGESSASSDTRPDPTGSQGPDLGADPEIEADSNAANPTC
jgi:hypothetical protein